MADYLAAIAREVRAGSTVTAAFLIITPGHPGATALQPAWRRARDGTPLVEALGGGLGAPGAGPPGGEVAAHAIACAADVGGSAAVAIDAAATVLRERDAVVAEARAHSAQARLSARVLTVVPLGFAAWSAVSDERIRSVYTASAVGAACVLAGLLLNAAGWWWMRRIIVAGGGR